MYPGRAPSGFLHMPPNLRRDAIQVNFLYGITLQTEMLISIEKEHTDNQGVNLGNQCPNSHLLP